MSSALLPFPSPVRLFFFSDPAPASSYSLSLHDALPISLGGRPVAVRRLMAMTVRAVAVPSLHPRSRLRAVRRARRSEEHTSELQSPCNLVCRLLLEKKNNQQNNARN